MFDVLFNTILLFKQLLTGLKVAVGRAFTLTVVLDVPTQPLLVVAVNTATKLLAVA